MSRFASCLLMSSVLVTGVSAAWAVPREGAPAPQPAESNGSDAIVGRWRPDGKDVIVAITKQGTSYGGVVVESGKQPELVGKALLRGLTYDAGRAAWVGEVFAPKRGEWVRAMLQMVGPASMTLTAGWGLFSKKVSWIRA